MTTAPPFTYYGGKTRMASVIVEALPMHRHYVEPFAGSLAVLLAKPRSAMETVNDIDNHLMTFWRVLRERPEDLEVAMHLTPHSRTERAAAYDLDADDELETARRVWVRLSQGRGGTLRNTGWRFYRNPSGSTYGMPDYLAAYAERVPVAAARLHGVSLECRDALDVIREYGKHDDVLLYCDPPYLGSTRAMNYRHEMTTDPEHEELADVLHRCAASVVLSGYASDLYDHLYAGWHRLDISAWTGNGIRAGATKTDGKRTEVLWSNRPIQREATFDFAR